MVESIMYVLCCVSLGSVCVLNNLQREIEEYATPKERVISEINAFIKKPSPDRLESLFASGVTFKRELLQEWERYRNGRGKRYRKGRPFQDIQKDYLFFYEEREMNILGSELKLAAQEEQRLRSKLLDLRPWSYEYADTENEYNAALSKHRTLKDHQIRQSPFVWRKLEYIEADLQLTYNEIQQNLIDIKWWLENEQ